MSRKQCLLREEEDFRRCWGSVEEVLRNCLGMVEQKWRNCWCSDKELQRKCQRGLTQRKSCGSAEEMSGKDLGNLKSRKFQGSVKDMTKICQKSVDEVLRNWSIVDEFAKVRLNHWTVCYNPSPRVSIRVFQKNKSLENNILSIREGFKKKMSNLGFWLNLRWPLLRPPTWAPLSGRFLSNANEVSTGPTCQFLCVCFLSVCLFFKASNWMIYWLLTVVLATYLSD